MKKETQNQLLEIVRQNYEEISADFSETRKKALWPELERFSKKVPNGARVLDLGCGSGRLLRAFLDKEINYLGIDQSQGLIQLARENFQNNSENKTQFSFLKHDMLALDNLDCQKFDYIFCVAVLHHLPGFDLQIKALRQMREKLNPNGKIIITVWNLWTKKKFRKLMIKNIFLKFFYPFLYFSKKNKPQFIDIQKGWRDLLFSWQGKQGQKQSLRYYHAFTKRELKNIIRKTKLQIEKISKDKYNYYVILRKF